MRNRPSGRGRGIFTGLFTLIAASGLALLGASPGMAADSCPNAEFRTGAAQYLPDCRAYEMISPVQKNNGGLGNDANVGTLGEVRHGAARGSLLVAFLFHAQLNNPIWPDAQPWDMWIFVAAAVVIAVLNRKAMLSRGRGVTQVLMPWATEGESAASSRPLPRH